MFAHCFYQLRSHYSCFLLPLHLLMAMLNDCGPQLLLREWMRKISLHRNSLPAIRYCHLLYKVSLPPFPLSGCAALHMALARRCLSIRRMDLNSHQDLNGPQQDRIRQCVLLPGRITVMCALRFSVMSSTLVLHAVRYAYVL